MAITYKNADDDAAFRKQHDEFIQSLSRHVEDAMKDGKSPFSMLYDDSETYLKTKYKSIGDLLKTWGQASSKVKGVASLVFGDQESDTILKPSKFSVDNDTLIISIDVDNEREVTVKDFVKQVKSHLVKFYLRETSGFQFNFRGNALDIETVVMIAHEDDDDATFLVEFNSSQVSAKKRSVKAAATAKDLLQQIDLFFNENTSLARSARGMMKVVGLVDDGHKQEAFQIGYPREQGSQAVFNLAKCPSWRFKEIANDPETMTVAQLQDCAKRLQSKNGYLFMKAKDQTYGVAGIDMLESSSSYDDEGQHVVVALLLKPWSDLFETRHPLRKSMSMNESIIGAQLDAKKLVYKALSSLAMSARCKLLLLDKSTYSAWSSKLDDKMRALKVPANEIREMQDAIEEHGCVAVLKSSQLLSRQEIAQKFASVKLDVDDIYVLHVSRSMSLNMWWFAVNLNGMNEI